MIDAQGTVMLHNNPASYHSNRYDAQSACQYCEGVIRHERWCLAQNPAVRYACEIVVYPEKLTIGDAIILHSACRGAISTAEHWIQPEAKFFPAAPFLRFENFPLALQTTAEHSVQPLTSFAPDPWQRHQWTPSKPPKRLTSR